MPCWTSLIKYVISNDSDVFSDVWIPFVLWNERFRLRVYCCVSLVLQRASLAARTLAWLSVLLSPTFSLHPLIISVTISFPHSCLHFNIFTDLAWFPGCGLSSFNICGSRLQAAVFSKTASHTFNWGGVLRKLLLKVDLNKHLKTAGKLHFVMTVLDKHRVFQSIITASN